MSSRRDSHIFLSAREMQDELASGSLTSVDLVQQCLAQIERHNHAGAGLHAIISACPAGIALEQARALDQERSLGKLRGELHGIPIVIKDAIVTDPSLGMKTTVGSFAFANMKSTRSAALVDQMKEAGLIILGKANMTAKEFCGLKSDDTPIGWSPCGGQTISAYRRDGLEDKDQVWCGGSSSGSAVSVAAGFAPLSLGTETGGSNVFPASVSGLYGLTLTLGSVATDGVFKLSSSFDRLGTMARNPQDLALLAETILTREARSKVPRGGYTSAMTGSWDGLSIGVVSNTWGLGQDHLPEEKWKHPAVKTTYEAALNTMRVCGARIVYPLDAPSSNILRYEQETSHSIVSHYEFPLELKKFISENFEPFPAVSDLPSLVAWNEAHASQEMPEPYTTQTELIKCQHKTMSPETHAAAVEALRRLADPDGMGAAMRSHNLDLVLAPSDSTLVSFAACAGWPVATVPLGKLEHNGQPWGFFVLARAGREDLLFSFMAAFHATFPAVERPTRV